MQIRSLTGLSLEAITEAFNAAFSDYVIHFQLTPAEMAFRMRMCSMDMDWSVGCFEGEELVGFILSGYRITEHRPTLYNGGTGVIPAFRGQRLTQRMYDYLIPKAESAGIRRQVLEVINTNQKAYRAYEVSGFHTSRTLDYWNGPRPAIASKVPGIGFKKMDSISWQQVLPWWEIQPAWPAQIAALESNWAEMVPVGAFMEDELVGYAVLLPKPGRFYHICVRPDMRRRGIGRALFGFTMVYSDSEKMNLPNVDGSSAACDAFARSLGMKRDVRQWEMVRKS